MGAFCIAFIWLGCKTGTMGSITQRRYPIAHSAVCTFPTCALRLVFFGASTAWESEGWFTQPSGYNSKACGVSDIWTHQCIQHLPFCLHWQSAFLSSIWRRMQRTEFCGWQQRHATDSDKLEMPLCTFMNSLVSVLKSFVSVTSKTIMLHYLVHLYSALWHPRCPHIRSAFQLPNVLNFISDSISAIISKSTKMTYIVLAPEISVQKKQMINAGCKILLYFTQRLEECWGLLKQSTHSHHV